MPPTSIRCRSCLALGFRRLSNRWAYPALAAIGVLTASGEVPTDWRAARPKLTTTNQETNLGSLSSHSGSEGALSTFNAGLKEHRTQDLLPIDRQSPTRVLQLYETSALMGHAPALVNLGGALEAGWGCQTDRAGSLVNYELASQLGHPLGDYNWARAALSNPDLADANRTVVTERLERAAESGVREAAYLRGWISMQADHPQEAANWFAAAAQQGFPEAAYALGWLHASRRLPRSSRGECLKWFQNAEDADLPLASYALARFYHEGDDAAAPDFHRAARHLERASLAGIPEAQYMLGFYRYYGKISPADSADAYRWFSLASRSGFAPAIRARNGLLPQLTSDELSQGNKLIEAFRQTSVPRFQWCSTASMIARGAAHSTRLPGIVVNDSGWVVGWGGELPQPPVTGKIVTASGRVSCREVIRSTRDGLVLLQVEGAVPPWRPVPLSSGSDPLPENSPVKFAAVDPSGPPDSDRWFARLKWAGGTVQGIGAMPASLRRGVVLDDSGRLVSLATGNGRDFLNAGALGSFLRQAGWVPPKDAKRAIVSAEGFPETLTDSLVHLELSRSP